MNELAKTLIGYAQTGSGAAFGVWLLVGAAMYYLANTIVGVVKWIAIGFRGYPPAGTDISDEID
jgi:hypothetical protein